MTEKKHYVATVHLLLQVDNHAEACDAVSAMLTENLMEQPDSGLVDWCYEYDPHRTDSDGSFYASPQQVELPDDADEDAWHVAHYEQNVKGG